MGDVVVFFKKALKYLKSDSGAVLPMAALLFPIIIGMAGIGVDISNWMMFKREMQTSADAAALAGAWDLANGASEDVVKATALKEAKKNWYDDSVAGNSLIIKIYSAGEDDDNCGESDAEHSDAEHSDGEYSDSEHSDNKCKNARVKVEIKGKTDTWFSAYFLSEDIYIGTEAEAEVVKESKFCVLGLDETASATVTSLGNVNLDAEDCGIAVNSNSSTALSFGGNSKVELGEVKLVGDYELTGGSVDFSYKKMLTEASATKDPYVDLDLPVFASCSDAQQNAGPSLYTDDTTLDPGVFCGGLKISGNDNVILNPGTYIMDGGDFESTGNGTIVAIGVTIILTNSGTTSYGSYGNIKITGAKDIRLSAPTSGDYNDIAVYQDRLADEGSTYNKIKGTVGLEVDGAIYTPQRKLEFGGNGKSLYSSGDDEHSDENKVCTKIVAKQVVFSGNPIISNDCKEFDSDDENDSKKIGNATARLIR